MDNIKAFDVFLSHSSKDRKLVIAMCHFLEEKGLRCWMAPRDIKGGTEYADALEKAIQSSSIMVVVFTENTNSSRAVRYEVERAFHHQLAIIPFRTLDIIPENAFAFFLGATHWLDAIDGKAEDYFDKLYENCASLLSDTGRLTAKLPQASRAAPSTNKTNPLPTVAIAAVAAIIIIVFAYFLLSGNGATGPKNHETARDSIDKDTTSLKAAATQASTPVSKQNTNDSLAAHVEQRVLPATGSYSTIPAALRDRIDNANYEQPDGTDLFTFSINGNNRLHLTGTFSNYQVESDLVYTGNNSFKTIKGDVNGKITFTEDYLKAKGYLTVVSTPQISRGIRLERTNE